MDRELLKKIIQALNEKQVNQPCPRCSQNNFSVVGVSEINVVQAPPPRGLLESFYNNPTTTTMPTVIVTCDNCGYVSQHAQAALGLLRPKSISDIGSGLGGGIGMRGK